jgi:hypothetical protein
MELSGTIIPSCPLNVMNNTVGRETIYNTAETACLPSEEQSIQTRCQELLTFVDSLPEQSIS